MADLEIPEEHRKALIALLTLPKEATDNLFASLSKASPSVQLDALAKAIAAELKTASIEQPETAAAALVALHMTRARSDVPLADFVADLIATLAQDEPEALSGERGDRARQQLSRLLSFEPLSTASKALGLLVDQERLFTDARILTDARPIYGIDPGAKPVGVVINQTLRITYLQDDKRVDFYIALDSEDISKLKQVLNRAEIKAESLKEVFQTSNIPIVRS